MFRVPLDLDDDEFDAYQAIVDRIAGESSLSYRAYLGLVTTGCVVALACAALLFAAGAVTQGGGAVLSALVFGAFWLGAWGPSIWSWLLGPRARSEAQERARRGLRDAVLIVGARRLAMGGDGWRAVLERRAVHAVTSEGVLTLVWRQPDLDPYPFAAIPTCRLAPAQQAELAAFPASRSSGQDDT